MYFITYIVQFRQSIKHNASRNWVHRYVSVNTYVSKTLPVFSIFTSLLFTLPMFYIYSTREKQGDLYYSLALLF